jgi:hypothetical protein
MSKLPNQAVNGTVSMLRTPAASYFARWASLPETSLAIGTE